MKTTARTLLLCCALGAPAQAQTPTRLPAAEPRGDIDRVAADAMATAWLHDLLGSPPRTTLHAYRAVIEDTTEPRVQRVRAAARAVPIAAALGDDDVALWHVRAAMELVPWRDGSDPAAMLHRLTTTQDAMRAWAANPATDADPRAVQQRLHGEPWRTLESLGSRPVPTPEALERMLRVAQERGDADAAARLRQELEPQSDAAGPREIQQRRWARDILEWELAGQREKATRMYPTVLRRRNARTPFTLNRFEAEMSGKAAQRLSPAEHALLERALLVARQRVEAGDTRGAMLLIGPALIVLRPVD